MVVKARHKPERLETLFALEFGQLLENHIFGSPIREEVIEIVCSSLGLKNKNQLAQIYAGYDTPSTANIFELVRTLNCPEFTERFLNLQTTLLNLDKSQSEAHYKIQNENKTETKSKSKLEENRTPYWLLPDKDNEGDNQADQPSKQTREFIDPNTSEWGEGEDLDLSLFDL